jgi:hypothetical protein
MSFKNTIFIAVFLLAAVIVYFLYKDISNSSQNSLNPSLSISDSVITSNPSESKENIIPEIIKHDSDKIIIAVETGKEDDVMLIVYYFHATARCTECINMIFLPLNIEDSANEHYINDFQLDVSTVILSKVINNKQVRWKNLEHVWKYADDKQLFFKYVRKGINDFLNQKDET